MKKSLIFASAALAIVLASIPQTASAQVAFGGTFRGPHGSFSIGVGAPFVPVVGAYVPQTYISQVYLSPGYGYGFVYNSRWIPCRPYGSRWIIAGAPIVYSAPYVRTYGYGYHYIRPYPAYYGHRHFNHRDAHHDRHGGDGHRW